MVGLRSAIMPTGRAHAKSDPDTMRELLRPHIKAYCDMLASNALRGDRTCVRIFADLVGETGGKLELINALVVSVGANSTEHLRAAASSALDAETQDDETTYLEALGFVNDYRKRTGLPALVESAPDVAGA